MRPFYFVQQLIKSFSDGAYISQSVYVHRQIWEIKVA
jgi:uncharacterized protein YqgQ